MNIVIIGAGKIGATLTEQLLREGHEITVVDTRTAALDMGFSQKQAVAIAYMLSAILGMAAVVLTNDGEMKALIFIGAVIVVGAIGVLVIFHRHPDKTEENAKKPEEEPHEEN